jgi:hypothetical protein
MSTHLDGSFDYKFTLQWCHFEKGLRLEIESQGNNQMGKINQNLKPISRYQKNKRNKGRGLSLITTRIHGFFT